ncbi:MAG: alpha-glucosidase [Oscillospiraceae bacterium]|nr:alpha-glucosidase [Oscillospiraceae bacterium]
MNNQKKTGYEWWKDAVVYQVYPRSFSDSNGDGIGDIPGILTKLDYLAELGVDAIWLSPVYCSPQYDNGYDISDYRAIDPIFGTMDDMDRLIQEADRRGIRILMDLVLNHSSDEHFWFREACKSRDNPYHDYYIWRDEPNEMKAGFGGPAWKWVPEVGQYYFFQFSPRQPDLNWDNPKVRQELYDMIRWWRGKGIGGFRLDVVNHLGKDPDRQITTDGPRLHEYIREMSREAFSGAELLTVGEAWSATPERAKLYSCPDGSELSMVFQFQHILLDQQENGDKWDLAPLPLVKLKAVMTEWQQGLANCGWNSLFLENHDLPRIVSRWANDGKYRAEAAKMLAALLFGLQGTPFVYQGQELGMTNAGELSLDDYLDIETLDMIRARRKKGVPEEEILRSARAKSRDNARTPMQWDGSGNAGFSSGKPWLPVNSDYREVNAETERKDPDSVFHFYRKLICLRREYSVFRDGSFEMLLPEDGNLVVYKRKTADAELLVICNFRNRTLENPLTLPQASSLLIGNYRDNSQTEVLRPYEARIYISGI